MKSKIIPAIAFSCLPMMGFGQTPPEVWVCDYSGEFFSDWPSESEEVLLIDVDTKRYYRPETREYFTGEGNHVESPNTWVDICSDRDGAFQLILTDYGCHSVRLGETFAVSGIVYFGVDGKEVSTTMVFLSDGGPTVQIENYTNCEVVSPLIFE